MRLGGQLCMLKKKSNSYKMYKKQEIIERHRHRYEFNTKYLEEFAQKGMIFSGESDEGRRMEILEIPSHKFFVGVQFHPEFNSRPGYPEHVFKAFTTAANQN